MWFDNRKTKTELENLNMLKNHLPEILSYQLMPSLSYRLYETTEREMETILRQRRQYIRF